MTAKETATKLAEIFTEKEDKKKPNEKSIKSAIKCCKQIIESGDCPNKSMYLNCNEEKKRYWNSVIKELKEMRA